MIVNSSTGVSTPLMNPIVVEFTKRYLIRSWCKFTADGGLGRANCGPYCDLCGQSDSPSSKLKVHASVQWLT